jgi:hypothetical protein
MPRSFRSSLQLVLPLVLFLASCNSSPNDTRPPVTGAAFAHATECALVDFPAIPFGDDWCDGMNWHWYLRADFVTGDCTDDISAKVYVITTAGDRLFFAKDTHVQRLNTWELGVNRRLVVQAIAPRDSVGDNDRGFPRFEVEVYAGGKSEPFGTFTVYSDIPLAPNTDFERRFCADPPYPDPRYPKRQNPDKN